MLLDSASLYFRAFYGVPDTVTAPDGSPVNAVRGFLDIIAKLVTDFAPDELVACWDDDWRPRWRVELIPSYKAHRVAELVPGGVDVEEVPAPLVAQVPLIREVLDALSVPVVGAAEHEADDVIGTLAATSRRPVDVVTGDRDLFQLVDDSRDVRIVYTARGMSNLEVVTEATVRSKYGIGGAQYADFATMRGDTSDGLPGVAGVGEKTAAALLAEYGDLPGIIAAAEDPASAMKPAMRARFAAAAGYLEVAPRVVEVARDLELAPFEASIRRLPEEQRARLGELGAAWGLGGSLDRAVAALENASA
ncbi:5'-3' exonuclease [Leifsonia sp. AG29]|uniref:5'-3' exonuclease n=1 Tax=Leifsonia sp. AG29 TaxID=2598860 RepID=UPI00131EB412|nr:5'-3' exonuclease [Leifsonia sp. AG29]